MMMSDTVTVVNGRYNLHTNPIRYKASKQHNCFTSTE